MPLSNNDNINFPASLDDGDSMPQVTQFDQFDAPGVRQDHVINRLVKAVKALEAAVGITNLTNTPVAGDGSPEAVVVGGQGRLYTDKSIDPPSLWVKTTAGGNTGWRQLIA